MIDLLVRGGLLFTIPLTIVALGILAAAGWAAVEYVRGRDGAFWKRAVFHFGLFGLVLGLFSHAIGLYEMMGAIKAAGDINPAIVAGGLRVSLIAPLYGLGIFAGAMLLWLTLHLLSRRIGPRPEVTS